MGLSDEQHDVVHIVGTVVGSISFTCNLLTLMLIYRSHKWGGYILLLLSLTITQMIYDVNYIMRIIETETVCYVTMFLGKFFSLSFILSFSFLLCYFSSTYFFSLSFSLSLPLRYLCWYLSFFMDKYLGLCHHLYHHQDKIY